MKRIKLYTINVPLLLIASMLTSGYSNIKEYNLRYIIRSPQIWGIANNGDLHTVDVADDMINEDLTDYSIQMVSYNENLSYIEYPKIVGLEDKEKEAKINKILEEQVLYGAKDWDHNTFVDFDVKGVSYIYSTEIGFCNNDIANFQYNFYAADTIHADEIETFGTQGSTSRSYGVTIDMATGEKIELWDFLIIDERLIESTDGTGLETNFEKVDGMVYHSFKDLFRVSDTEENEDAFHIFTYDETIEDLKDVRDETNWYIDKDKNIEFTVSEGAIKIPYTEIREIIYPKYIDILED